MSASDPFVSVAVMIQRAENVLGRIEGLDHDLFLADTVIQEAVALNLILIGEAAGRVLRDHPSFAADHPHIPWARIKGLRNQIAHGYDSLDFHVIWYTVAESIPVLLAQLRSLMGARPGTPDER